MTNNDPKPADSASDRLTPAPPAPPPAQNPQPDGELARELSRARLANKILKIATVLLTLLFLLVATAIFFIYKKVAGMAALAETPVAEHSKDYSFGLDETPMPTGAASPGMRVRASTEAHGSGLTVFVNSKEYAQDGARDPSAEARAALGALRKYSDRPIVKDFIAAAKKEPEFARAMKNNPEDPLAFVGSMQNMPALQNLLLKFVMRKDFAPFLKEVAGDPEVRPLMKVLPDAQMAQMLQMLDGASGARKYRSRFKSMPPEKTRAPERKKSEPRE